MKAITVRELIDVLGGYPQDGVVADYTVTLHVGTTPQRRLSADAVLGAMLDIGAPCRAGQVAAYVDGSAKNVGEILLRMVADGTVRRVKRGLYEVTAIDE